MSEISVTKRNGKVEPLDYEKIHSVLSWATEGLKKVHVSDIEVNAKLQLYDGIPTSDIHRVLVQSAQDLISPKNHNYQYVASKLLNYCIRKEIFNTAKDMPDLEFIIRQNVEAGVYDPLVLEKYSSEDMDVLNDYIKHDRDFNFAYGGLQQLIDKYLLKDRKTDKIYETPQFMYMMIAMTLFQDYKKTGVRYNLIRKFYNDISLFKLSLPTPIMCGVRTPNRQFSSCTLIDVDDNLDSIFSSDHAIGNYTAKRAGIGLNCGRIRGVGAKIRGGEVVHTGVVPFLKKFEKTTRCCTQNGVRGGNSTTHFPFWHQEIEDILVLKNNKGTDDNRVRKMDYSIQLCRLFYRRFVANEDIALFSPHSVPDLYDAFGLDNDIFEELYEKYEQREDLVIEKINARDLLNSLIQERVGTGRIYIMNLDHCNTHSAFQDKIVMSNLCQEITLPTSPIQHIDDGDDTDSEIALCVLSAINVGGIEKLSSLEDVCLNAVRALDYVIENQDYPVMAARKMLKRRSLGIGVTNFAYYLAKHKVRYDSPEALDIVDELMEHIQYYCIKASVELAKELGPCEWFHKTKYSQGILPIDTYNKNVDELVSREHTLDWEGLRSDVKEFGMRNSCLTALMPCESSSAVTNSTNGIETPRGLLSVKKSKQGLLKVLVPEVDKIGHHYTLAYEMENNSSINKIVAVIQKWVDQSISSNHYYDFTKCKEGELPLSVVANDLLEAYKYGVKTLYYANTNDGKTDDVEESCSGGGCSV
jgi:ribonucleoside-diphosphate reductase alpha chain